MVRVFKHKWHTYSMGIYLGLLIPTRVSIQSYSENVARNIVDKTWGWVKFCGFPLNPGYNLYHNVSSLCIYT